MNLDSESAAARWLLTPAAIRSRCQALFARLERDELTHFRLASEQLGPVAERVLDVTKAAYPTLDIPHHSRWRHFDAGGLDRWAGLRECFVGDVLERSRVAAELAVTSVLLDAGAGPAWTYREPNTQQVFSRSEGLAVASFHLYCNGAFSATQNPLCADAVGLKAFDVDSLRAAFQVAADNPLEGCDGRAKLLQQLGSVIAQTPAIFGTTPRVGHLIDYLLAQAVDGTLAAERIFAAVVEGLAAIWPGRLTLGGRALGDVWLHSALADSTAFSEYVPFHKLSQWLSYSLVEPLEWLGIQVKDLDTLTGLPEYRNGGLFLDAGVLELKDPEMAQKAHRPSDELIVEWRALTVVLLDRIAIPIRRALGKDEQTLPLSRILQGGTWSTGRALALERRADGSPPLNIVSDGTVF